MAHGFITTEETKWLRDIEKLIRISNGYLARIASTKNYQPIAQFTIGDGNPGTPANNTTTYSNPAMDGYNVKIYLNGTGYLTEGTGAGQYQLLTGGGFVLQGGTEFTTSQTYTVFIYS
jgi:hypothetical protein